MLLQKMGDGHGKTPVPAEALQCLKWKEEEVVHNWNKDSLPKTNVEE